MVFWYTKNMKKQTSQSASLSRKDLLTPRKFNVYIIESPSAPDLYVSQFEGKALSETLKLSGISSS